MGIVSSEIKFYKSNNVSDSSANGGRISSNEILDNVKNNLWPDVSEGERAAGSTKYRKCFIKIANDDDLTLINSRLYVSKSTLGEDRIVAFPGTQTDTQAAITGTERLYGCATLVTDAPSGGTQLVVNTESVVDNIFRDGDLLFVSNKEAVDSLTGFSEFIEVAASSAVSYNGTQATINLASPLVNSYTVISSTSVASVIQAGDIKPLLSDWSESSASGTYDEVTYPVVLDSIGGIEQTWTLTFTNATTFSCTGDTVGLLGTGTISGDYEPSNPNFSKPYFKLLMAGWGGTWATNNVVSFKTHPAAYPIWEKRVVPENCASLSGNSVTIAVSGESE